VAPVPRAVDELRTALAGADAVLIATPEYNHSAPGQLKNALDWASRPFPGNSLRDKPAAVIGASTSLFGAVWAQAEVSKVLAAIGAQVVDEELPVATAHEAFEADGSLRDPELQARLADILRQLLSLGGLEELDRVAGGILEQDLAAAPAGGDLVAEARAGPV
jgi:chromate reductase, NAD(P)H dehydrogenase (quinone)